MRDNKFLKVNNDKNNWGNWSPCSKTCGNGIRKRCRLHNNLTFREGGEDCTGSNAEVEPCIERECPADSYRYEQNYFSFGEKRILHYFKLFLFYVFLVSMLKIFLFRCKWNGHLCKGETMRRVRKWDSSSKSGGKGCAGSESEEQDEVEKRIQLRGNAIECFLDAA